MKNRVWILGASDPEMSAIEALLVGAGERVEYCSTSPESEGGRRRVHPGNAYTAGVAEVGCHETVVLVECSPTIVGPDGREHVGRVVVVDHHRPGDPGYGLPPADYWRASSLGQVWGILNPPPETEDEWREGPRPVTQELLLVAAADHCLAAAYAGQCPGVDPGDLATWRAESRAAFQGRAVEEVLRDVRAAKEIVAEAPTVVLRRAGLDGEPSCGEADPHAPDWCAYCCPEVTAIDLRGAVIPELPEALCQLGEIAIYQLIGRDGRVKIGIMGAGAGTKAGTAPIEAFLETWAPARHLENCYGDPARGFAGGYLP